MALFVGLKPLSLFPLRKPKPAPGKGAPPKKKNGYYERRRGSLKKAFWADIDNYPYCILVTVLLHTYI